MDLESQGKRRYRTRTYEETLPQRLISMVATLPGAPSLRDEVFPEQKPQPQKRNTVLDLLLMKEERRQKRPIGRPEKPEEKCEEKNVITEQ